VSSLPGVELSVTDKGIRIFANIANSALELLMIKQNCLRLRRTNEEHVMFVVETCGEVKNEERVT
jgi:hypothetical protein